MEAADQEKTESYKVIFLFYFMWYLFALIIRMVFFTVSQELEEKMRTLEALFQEKNSDYQVIFDYCMRYYQHIQLFLSSFNQELDKKIRAMETSTSIGQSNHQVIFDCCLTLYHMQFKIVYFSGIGRQNLDTRDCHTRKDEELSLRCSSHIEL